MYFLSYCVAYYSPLRFLFFFLVLLIILLLLLYAYLPSPNLGLTSPGTTSQMPVGQLPVGGATVSGPEHQTDTQRRASLNVWSAQCQGLRRRQQRKENRQRHTSNPRTEIKILDPAGNRTRADGLEGRYSTDHATATDGNQLSTFNNLIRPYYIMILK